MDCIYRSPSIFAGHSVTVGIQTLSALQGYSLDYGDILITTKDFVSSGECKAQILRFCSIMFKICDSRMTSTGAGSSK